MLPLFLLGAAAAGSGGAAAGTGLAAGAAGLGAAAAKGAAGSAGGNFFSRLFGHEPDPPDPPYQLRSAIMNTNTPNPFEELLGGMSMGMPRRKVRFLRHSSGSPLQIDPRYAQALGG